MLKEELTLKNITKVIREEMKGLATKKEMKGLATKKEMKGLATKEEVQGIKGEMKEIKEDMKGLATKEEVQGIKGEMKGIKEDMKGLATKEEMKGIKEELESFAQVVKNEFDNVGKEFVKVNENIKALKQGQENIELKNANVAYRFELEELKHRVGIIEKKIK
jgi:flagellar hook-basal body complex protein FliE